MRRNSRASLMMARIHDTGNALHTERGAKTW